MGIKRGTILGLLAVAGAVIERTFGVLQGVAMDVLGVGSPPTVLGWIARRRRSSDGSAGVSSASSPVIS